MNKIPFFIGPCVIEGEDFALKIADQLVNDLKDYSKEIDLYFKGSFDKANRSSINGFRGMGLEEGLRVLEKVKKATGLPTITDFHTPDQAVAVSEVVDVLQVPAFLCRQTDMILEGAKASLKNNCILKIKKGQFLSPSDTKNIVDKAKTILPMDKIYLTERGSSFGYNRLIVDMSGYQEMKSFGVKVIHDATHCVQRPGGLGDKTGGMREAIIPLAKAAISAGADGIFMEAHPDPHNAKSDAATQMQINQVKKTVGDFIKLKRFIETL